MSNVDTLLHAIVYGDEDNPPIVPTKCKAEAFERYEKAKVLARELEEAGALHVVTIDDKPARKVMEIWVEWLDQDDEYKAKEIADFIALFDNVGFTVENAWVLKTEVYK